jgi:hypothetical protein
VTAAGRDPGRKLPHWSRGLSTEGKAWKIVRSKMIDQTNVRIGLATAELRRRKAREQKFDRLLRLTDVVLWQLEEMNRDGVASVPQNSQAAIVDKLAAMPESLRRLYRADGSVQLALDSLFEMQQALFKARHPEFDYGETDELDPD